MPHGNVVLLCHSSVGPSGRLVLNGCLVSWYMYSIYFRASLFLAWTLHLVLHLYVRGIRSGAVETPFLRIPSWDDFRRKQSLAVCLGF